MSQERAAAARIAAMAAELADAVARLEQPAVAVVLASLSRPSLDALRVIRAAPAPAGGAPADLAGLAAWLRANGQEASGALIAELAEAGIGPAALEPLADELDADSLGRILEWLPARLRADRLPGRLRAAAAELASPE